MTNPSNATLTSPVPTTELHNAFDANTSELHNKINPVEHTSSKRAHQRRINYRTLLLIIAHDTFMILDSNPALFEPVGMQFITYDNKENSLSHDAKRRQLIRKQAKIASQNTQKSQLNSASSAQCSPTKARSPKDYQGRFRLQKRSQIPHDNATYNEIGPYISPLGPTFRSLGDDASILLSYYYHVFQGGCVSIDFEDDWLAFVLSNKATSHALMTLIALKYEVEAAEEVRLPSSQHGAAAVRHLRKEIESCPEVPDDSIVCAVALMTVSESIRDDVAASAMHFGGLNRMLHLRGGSYDSFSHNITLQKVISWARRIHCLQSNEPLDLPPVPAASRATFDCFDEEAQTRNTLQALSMKRNSYTHVISRELEDILDGLQILSSFPPGASRSSAHRRTISYIVYDTEYKLIILNQRHLAGLSCLSSGRVTLSKSYQLAVQIYVLAALRRLQFSSALVQRYVRALRFETQKLQLPAREIDVSSARAWTILLIWVESVLALATVNTEHTAEILVNLKALFECIGCVSLEEYMALLKEVCWLDLDGYLDDIIAGIWTRAMQEDLS